MDRPTGATIDMGAGLLRIGTRASALARTQTGWVADRLAERGVATVIEFIETSGDRRTDVSVAGIGGDGVFVRELERALLDGRIDVAVHSMKDLPTADSPGLAIPCVPGRATPFDAFVGRTASTLAGLPPGAVVGTASVRRVVQVKRFRGDLVIKPIRGNVDTRLRKLDAGEFDGLILAAAGLERLGLGGRITELLQPPMFWPAVAQGALAVQIRESDAAARAAVIPISDAVTHRCVRAERACLAALAGGCLAPIAAWARPAPSGELLLDACVYEDRESDVACVQGTGIVRPEDAGPEMVGTRVAEWLMERGATEMLARGRRREHRQGVQPSPLSAPGDERRGEGDHQRG